MKKTLLFLIVAVTALFFGGNTNELNAEPEPSGHRKVFETNDVLPATTQLRISWAISDFNLGDEYLVKVAGSNFPQLNPNNTLINIVIEGWWDEDEFTDVVEYYFVVFHNGNWVDIMDENGDFIGDYESYIDIDTSTWTLEQRTITSYKTMAGDIYWEDLNPESEPSEDTTEPIIEGQAIISPIHNPFTMEQVKAQITASDDVDGDLTDSIVYEGGTYEAARLADELTINTTYTMIFSVTDTAGNKTTRSIDVIVKDIQAPFFGISDTTIDVEYWEDWNAELFISQLLVFDAYDSNPTVTVISNEFEIENSLDPQLVTYEATDASGNKSRITITLNKVDLMSPDFGGETEFDVPFLTKTPLAILLDGMYFQDEIDGEVSYTIVSDNYTTATTPGTYQVVLRGTDYSGNHRDQTITIRLIDGMPPILYITKNLLIGTDTVATLTSEQIIALVSQMENILNASIVVNNYTGNESTYGTYEVIVQGTDSNGEVKMYSTSIYVRSSELNYFTVTFETNGGNTMDSIQVVELGQLIVQSPLKEGYTFVGWYEDEALTQQFSLVNDRITSDTTLYAKWSTGGGVVSPGENSISVTYEVLALVCILAVGLYLWKKKN